MSEEQNLDDNKVAKYNAADHVGVVKKGDYLVHLFIQESRNLRMKGAETVDPIIEVSCMDKKKFTTCKDDIGTRASVNWSEHIFFEPKNLTERGLSNGKITMRILDQQMFKNACVGSYEMDLAYVYFQNKH